MATHTRTFITDDLDGSDDATTQTFALNGVEYTIDLTAKNAEKLEKALAPFVEKATRVGGRRRSSGSSSKRSDLADVRAWAKKNKHEVSERGRIPKAVLDAYDDAH